MMDELGRSAGTEKNAGYARLPSGPVRCDPWLLPLECVACGDGPPRGDGSMLAFGDGYRQILTETQQAQRSADAQNVHAKSTRTREEEG